MKRYFKILLSTVLLLGILSSGIGIPLLIHTCNISGEKSISLSGDGGCPAGKAQTGSSFQKDDCCSFQAKYVQVSTVSPKPKQWQAGFDLLPVIFLLCGIFLPELLHRISVSSYISPFLTSGGRYILCHIHILRN